MNMLKKILQWLFENRTKVLGYTQVMLGALAVADAELLRAVLGDNGPRWIILLSGVLTAIVGHYNSSKPQP